MMCTTLIREQNKKYSFFRQAELIFICYESKIVYGFPSVRSARENVFLSWLFQKLDKYSLISRQLIRLTFLRGLKTMDIQEDSKNFCQENISQKIPPPKKKGIQILYRNHRFISLSTNEGARDKNMGSRSLLVN
jgi:hypothetical protein